VEAGRRRVRVHLGDVAGAAEALEAQQVAVVGRGAAPDPVDGALAGEERLDVVRRPHVGLGDHGRRAGADEAGRVVVDPLLPDVERPFRQARLGVAARVAEVAEDHDRVPGELDLAADLVLAEVLVGVARADVRVEAHPVLARRRELVAVRAGPAVAVAEVDHDRGALEGLLDRRPRRERGVDPDDVRGVLGGRRGGLVGEAPVAVGRGARRPDDEDDLRGGPIRLGGTDRRRRTDRSDGHQREQDERDDDEGALHR
jgi:hypothetical protein